MQTYSEPCVARIDTAAIQNNTRFLVESGITAPLLADVSADGYGHGVVQAARAAIAGGAARLLVSSVADAASVRRADIEVPILASFSLEGGASDLPRDLGCALAGTSDARGVLYEPGSAIYGLGPLGLRFGLAPAMRVSATVMGIKTIEKGEGVSYGYTFRASERTNLAMVAMGYADGIDRRAGNISSMTIAGMPRRIVGRVAMNAAVLALGAETVSLGDEAVLFGAGNEPSAQSWAEQLGIRDIEAVTVFGRLLARSYL